MLPSCIILTVCFWAYCLTWTTPRSKLRGPVLRVEGDMAVETDLGSVIPLNSINCFQLQTSKDSSPQPCLKERMAQVRRKQRESYFLSLQHYFFSLWDLLMGSSVKNYM